MVYILSPSYYSLQKLVLETSLILYFRLVTLLRNLMIECWKVFKSLPFGIKVPLAMMEGRSYICFLNLSSLIDYIRSLTQNLIIGRIM